MSPPSPLASHAELAARRAALEAIDADDPDRLEGLIGANPRLLTLRLRGAPGLLSHAVRRGRRGLVALLVARGAPLAVPLGHPEDHVLVAAARAGEHRLARWLVGCGASLDTFVDGGWSLAPLWNAALECDGDALGELVLERCVALPEPKAALLAGLGPALRTHRNRLARALAEAALRAGAHLGELGPPLREALAHRNPNAARDLLGRGARLEAASYLDAQRLWPAVLRDGDETVAALILEAGFRPSQWELTHGSLLARWPEASPRAQPVITLLLAHGLDLNASAPGYGTPLYAALAAERIGLFRFLLGRGADPRHPAHRTLPPPSLRTLALLSGEERRELGYGSRLPSRNASGAQGLANKNPWSS